MQKIKKRKYKLEVLLSFLLAFSKMAAISTLFQIEQINCHLRATFIFHFVIHSVKARKFPHFPFQRHLSSRWKHTLQPTLDSRNPLNNRETGFLVTHTQTQPTKNTTTLRRKQEKAIKCD
jgi:hypothetical protein